MRHRFAPTLLALATLASAPDTSRAERWIVRLAPPAPATPAALRATHLAAQRARFADRLRAIGALPLATLDEGVPPPALDALGAAVGRGATANASDASGGAPNPFDLDPARTWLVDVADPALAAAALAADPDVRWAEPDQIRSMCVDPATWLGDGGTAGAALGLGAGAPMHPFTALGPGFPDDPMFRDTRQWGLWNAGPAGAYGGTAGADARALEAWQITTGAPAVKLAIADTGIDPGHPELIGVIPGFGERVTDGFNATLDPATAYADSHGHGTAVAGVFAARSNNGAIDDSLGVAGLAGGDGASNPGCRLVPIRITHGASGQAYSFDIARAVLHATASGARAMNLSFAGGSPSRAEREALYHALVRGCVVVAAAGNLGAVAPTAPQYPAAFAREGLCIQVGASDARDRRAVFSSYGPGLDLVAPGFNVWTTFLTYRTAAGVLRNGFAPVSGTSLAAPFATGAVGLLASVRPELIDRDFQQILRESAHDVGAPGFDAETAHGRLDVAAALGAVPPRFGVWHDEVAATSVTPLARDTLTIGDYGPGSLSGPRIWPDAELVEIAAAVAVPDSFLDSVRVWPRIGGTFALRDGFGLPFFAPWCEVTNVTPRSFDVRGYLYRVDETCDSCPPEDWIPLPPDMGRFGFTVIGRVDRAPSLAVTWPPGPEALAPGDSLRLRFAASDPDEVSAIEVWLEPDRGAALRLAAMPGGSTAASLAVPCTGAGGATLRVTARDRHGPRFDETSAATRVTLSGGGCPPAPALRVTPNPAFGPAVLEASGAGRLSIFDAAGRLVRRASIEADDPRWTWDGTDARGLRAAPGLYFARFEGGGGAATARLVRVE
jgi:hypothetical protein